MKNLKKYICSYSWGVVESDRILEDCNYYAEIKKIDSHELGRYRRCSIGSKTELQVLENIMKDNEIISNINN